MIIVRLMGGLGNQMFQYASGKALAERLRVPLQLDRSFLDQRSDNPGYTLRNFELDVFQIEAGVAAQQDISRMRKPLESRLYKKISGVFPSMFPDHVFYETRKTYMKEIESLKDPVYMEGYWQTEKYFTPIANQLRAKEFLPAENSSGLNADLLIQIKSKNAVSLHVRRGDYVTDTVTNKFHGTCSIDYYERSAKLIVEKTGADHFFIFSDEPDWVKKNIVLPFPVTIISHNKGRESYWDMFLMRNCKHHIIANSSFSWWGAWLNPSSEKIVIAPEKWFNDPSSSVNEIIPEGWIKN